MESRRRVGRPSHPHSNHHPHHHPYRRPSYGSTGGSSTPRPRKPPTNSPQYKPGRSPQYKPQPRHSSLKARVAKDSPSGHSTAKPVKNRSAAPVPPPAKPSPPKGLGYCVLLPMMLLVAGVLVALVLSFASNSSASAAVADPDISSASRRTAHVNLGAESGKPFYDEIRLPGTIVPLNYTVTLDVELDPLFMYGGHVKVCFLCKERTDLIVIHAKGDSMVIRQGSVAKVKGVSGEGDEDDDDDEIGIAGHARHPDHEQLQIKLGDMLEEGSRYSLSLYFRANLSETMTGFYRSSYLRPPALPEGARPKALGEAPEEGPKPVRRWLATTHFEPTDARSAFPCFDEPNLKANFTMILIYDYRLNALSNMPPQSTLIRDVDGKKVTRFETSVRMSTYLVAFVISDFKSMTRHTEHGLRVSVWAPEHQLPQATLALNAAAKILDYFDDFFGLPFPLPKQDLVAIPDFAAGAMENWGLITYRSTAMLVDPEQSSTANVEWVVTVVSHELAHQWFGNIVTMDWWDDLWLNEGFASYVQDIGAQHFDPSMRVIDQFATTTLPTALSLDALASSHPIAATVKDPNEINSIFDAISYSKGAAVIRMLESFLGAKPFSKGLNAYLRKHAYKNARTSDLWDAWREAVNNTLEVGKIMDTWTKQEGFPLITINVNSDRTSMSVSQSRFFASPQAAEAAKAAKEPMWHVPVTWLPQPKVQPLYSLTRALARNRAAQNAEAHIQKGKKTVWLNAKSSKIVVLVDIDPKGSSKSKDQGPVGWIKANAGQMGVYRVTYDDTTWGLLAQQLRQDHLLIPSIDRAGLMDDAFALAKASHVGLTLPLNLTRYLPNEREYLPWSAALKGFGWLRTLLQPRSTFGDFCKYFNKLVGPSVRRVGWGTKGAHLERYLRAELFHAALQCDYEPAKIGVLREFERWSRGISVTPDHRSLVYVTGVRYGGARAWERVRRMWQTPGLPPSEELKLRNALAASSEPWLLKRVLDMSLDENEIRRQDAVSTICAVARNPVGGPLVWEFLQQEWNEIRKRYGALSFELGSLLKCVIAAYAGANAFRLEKVQQFFHDRDTGAAASALKQALEEAEGNAAFIDRHEKELGAWLRAATKSRSKIAPPGVVSK
mmetsp:Transcript_31821/g.77554  ORF Transcript_31821/g.77554 Transcript_31821/m.77554 type:complete len:1119 (+) Transcript_31821:199-3555(+)